MNPLPMPVSTGQPITSSSKSALAVIGVFLIGTGSVYGLDRAESWRRHVQPRVPFVLDAQTVETSSEGLQSLDLRAAATHLTNIRDVLNMPVSDMAGFFEVSRQAIYKWLSGTSMPEPDKLKRIVALSRIADAFRVEGVQRAGSLLKMKTFGGRSLLELLKNGENNGDHVAFLIREAKTMESSYEHSGLATSKSKPTSDWLSSISIPGSFERS